MHNIMPPLPGFASIFAYFPGFRRWRGSTTGLFYGAPPGLNNSARYRSRGLPHNYQFVNTNYDIRNTNFKVRRLRRNVAKPCISYWCNYGSKR